MSSKTVEQKNKECEATLKQFSGKRYDEMPVFLVKDATIYSSQSGNSTEYNVHGTPATVNKQNEICEKCKRFLTITTIAIIFVSRKH